MDGSDSDYDAARRDASAARLLLDLGIRPDRDRAAKKPGYDAVMQAEGGLMSVTGAARRSAVPPRRRDRRPRRRAVRGAGRRWRRSSRASATGRGQRVDIAMLDSVAALLTYQAGIYFATGAAPMRMGNRHPTIVPYDTFRAADGDLVLAVGNDDQFRRLCTVPSAGPDLASDDPRLHDERRTRGTLRVAEAGARFQHRQSGRCRT